MGKILVSATHFDTLCKDAWDLLEKNGHEVIYDSTRQFPAYSFQELKEILPEMDAALIGMDNYNEEVFCLAPKLKAVAKFGVGVDNIDGKAAREHGVQVINAPGQNSESVAELTIAFMLDALRNILPLSKSIAQGQWVRSIGMEISDKTIGLIGFGEIGKRVARILKGFNARVLANDLVPDAEAAKALGVRMTDKEEIVRTCDIISLHIPSSAETYHLFDEKMFEKMKEGSYLINTARGALVDTDALCSTLQKGHLAGAALDAYEKEPLGKESPLLQCPNVILTPHTGAETKEAYRRVSLTVCQDICSVLAGKKPLHCTNETEEE